MARYEIMLEVWFVHGKARHNRQLGFWAFQIFLGQPSPSFAFTLSLSTFPLSLHFPSLHSPSSHITLAMSAINYSKWDNLEISDDSDIECHPNVTLLLFLPLYSVLISKPVGLTFLFAELGHGIGR